MKPEITEHKTAIPLSDQKGFVDESPPLPNYSATTIATLLQAYDIANQPDAKLTQDNNLEFDLYTYPPKPLTETLLAEDNVTYFLTQEKAASNRRVCFLLMDENKHPLALIAQFSNFNATQAKQLHQQLQEQQLNTAETILKNISLLPHFKKLYGESHLLFIGSTATPQLISQLQPIIKKALSGRVHLDCMPLPEKNASIALTEYILSMLQAGKTKDVVTLEAHKNHHQQCVTALLKFFEQLKIQDPEHYKQIINVCVILFKYLTLDQSRSQYHLPENSLQQMEALLEQDFQIKALIYQQDMRHFIKLFNALDFKVLIQLLETKNNPKILLQKLGKSHQIQLQALKDKENQLQNHYAILKKPWISYLTHQGKKVASFLYNSSLVSLGAEFIQWVGKPFTHCLRKNRFMNAIKENIQQITQKTIATVTRSQTLGEKSSQLVDHYFLTEDASRIFGATLGLAYSYYMGGYTLAHLMMVRIITDKISNYVARIKMNDEKATVIIPKPPFFLNRENAIRTISFSIALLETVFWHRNYNILINTSGALIGSLITTHLGKKYLSELQNINPNQPPTEDQVFISFLLSVIGHDFGYSITDFFTSTSTNIMNKLKARERILEKLNVFMTETPNFVHDVKLEFSQLMQNPWLWFNQKNPVTLEWRYDHENGIFRKAICEIGSYMTPKYEMADKLICQESSIEPPRLIARSH